MFKLADIPLAPKNARVDILNICIAPVEPLEPGGFALGSEFKIVAVERVGTTSTGVPKALAATERFVQTDVLEAGACPKEVPEPDIMYDSSPTSTSAPVVYDLLAL
jgi:hypothetical protein